MVRSTSSGSSPGAAPTGARSRCPPASSSRSSSTMGTSTARSSARSSARTASSRLTTPRSTGATSWGRSASGDLAQRRDPERRDRLVEALQLDLAGRIRLDRILDRRMHAAAHEDLAALRHRREAESLNDDHSHGAVIEAALEADAAHRRVADGDPDAEPEVVATLLPAGLQLGELLLHRERHARRAKLRIGDRHRVVEEDHHPVAREVLERALVMEDELAHRRVERA